MDEVSKPTNKEVNAFLNSLIVLGAGGDSNAFALLLKIRSVRMHPEWNNYLHSLVIFANANGLDLDALAAIAAPGLPTNPPPLVMIKQTSTVFQDAPGIH